MMQPSPTSMYSSPYSAATGKQMADPSPKRRNRRARRLRGPMLAKCTTCSHPARSTSPAATRAGSSQLPAPGSAIERLPGRSGGRARAAQEHDARRPGHRPRRPARSTIRTGGQLESWPWMRTGTTSVIGGPGGASSIGVTVRCAREGARMTDSVAAPAGTEGTAARRLVLVLLTGGAVAVALGVYGKVHDPTHEQPYTLFFSSTIQLKVWFATAALALAVRAGPARRCGSTTRSRCRAGRRRGSATRTGWSARSPSW